MKAILIRNGLRLRETFADESGHFSFLQLTEGDYEVKIESPGYQSYEHRVALRYPGHEEERFSARLTPLPADQQIAAAFAHPELFEQLSPVAQMESSGGKVQVVMGVPAPQIHFRHDDTQYHAEILFAAQIYGPDGKPAFKEPPVTRGFKLTLTVEQFRGLGTRPLLARSEVRLSPGRYKLVLVVKDRLKGVLGATVQHFTVF